MILLLAVIVAAPPVVTIDGKPIEQRWADFERRWFDYFDADHNGKLSPGEAAAIPPIPGDAGMQVAVDFAFADQNRDSFLAFDELIAFYERRGVRACSSVRLEVDRKGVRLSEAVLRLLDRNNDGALSKAEIALAAEIIDRADANEDEIVAKSELLAAVTRSDPKTPAVASTPELPRIEIKSSIGTAVGFEQLDRNRFLRRTPTETIMVDLSDAGDGCVVAGRKYLMGKWTSALGEEPYLTRSLAAASPGIDGMTALFPYFDSDHNGRLNTWEFERFADLLAEGAAARIHFIWHARGNNWFDHWDRDGDGRLSRSELTSPPLAPPPISWRLEIRRGPVGERFGALRLASQKIKTESAKAKFAAPPWFIAMDRNNDQRISAAEFLGRPERFLELDVNRDGFIDINEAARR